MSTNADRNEVEIKGKNDEVFTLRFGPNEICQIEEAIKKDLSDLINELMAGRVNVRQLRTIVQLSYVAPNGKPTQATRAGEILSSIGMKAVANAMTQGLSWIGLKTDEDEEEGSARPPDGGANGASSA